MIVFHIFIELYFILRQDFADKEVETVMHAY